MSSLSKFFGALAKEYGDDAVRIARDVLGWNAEPEALRAAAATIAKKAPPQTARRAAPADTRPVRRTATPARPLALPKPKGYKNPIDEGYRVVYRGDTPLPAPPYRAEGPFGGVLGELQSEGEAWHLASNAVNSPSPYKPRGGQWFPEGVNTKGALKSPEGVAKDAWSLGPAPWTPEGGAAEVDPGLQALQDWWMRAVPKYLKTDFATEQDPLLALAERNLLHMPDVDADQWRRTAIDNLLEDPIGFYTVPPHANNPDEFVASPGLREDLAVAAPWLAKQPVTDKLYALDKFAPEPLGLPHVADEMYNALRAGELGIPDDLAVRPETLQRMSFPQAVERVGRINQWRAKQMEEANLAAMQNNPAIQTFKEYPEAGFRWVELRQPTDTMGEYSVRETAGKGFETLTPDGRLLSYFPDEADARRAAQLNAGSDYLRDALKIEGDTMGHCVGGYCDDVASGRSRIFSLRDAKGNPHVTIETAPSRRVFSDVAAAVGGEEANRWLHDEGLTLAEMVARANIPQANDIVQIKGKQNRAPIDDYLPYVQDFVKSGKWGNVGDLGNAGLLKLPDGRYITEPQWNEVVSGALPSTFEVANPNPYSPERWTPEAWEQLKPHFEGFAIGGRVDASRFWGENPLAVTV